MQLPKKPRGRILGYARVSSLEQTLGTSLKDQQARMHACAKALGKPIAKDCVFVEAESGGREKLEKRTAMLTLMASARDGDLILCDKIDRWSRDPEFTYRSIRELREKGAAIYFVSDDCDPETSHGDDMLGQRVLFARMEHKRIKERMVGTRNLLQEKGFYVTGKIPYGYRRSTTLDRLEHNVLELVPKEAAAVREVFEEYLAGMSMVRLAKKHGRSMNFIHTMLGRRMYTGEIQAPSSAPGRRDGNWIKGRHPAIIDAATFARVAEARTSRQAGGPRPRGAVTTTSTWLVREVAYCARCGAKMTSAFGPNVPKRLYYYRCNKRCSPWVSVDEADESASEIVLAGLKSLAADLAKPPKAAAAAPDHAAARASLAKKRTRILEAFADGDMTRDERRAALQKVDEALGRLAVSERTAGPLDDAKARAELLKDFREIERAWWALEPVEMKAVIEVLVAKAFLAADRPAGTKPSRYSHATMRRPQFELRTLEDIYARLHVVRATLLRGLGRAPTQTEMIGALLRTMP